MLIFVFQQLNDLLRAADRTLWRHANKGDPAEVEKPLTLAMRRSLEMSKVSVPTDQHNCVLVTPLGKDFISCTRRKVIAREKDYVITPTKHVSNRIGNMHVHEQAHGQTKLTRTLLCELSPFMLNGSMDVLCREIRILTENSVCVVTGLVEVPD